MSCNYSNNTLYKWCQHKWTSTDACARYVSQHISTCSEYVHVHVADNYNIIINNYSKHTGLLESVSDLTVALINSTTVLISWSPPFTLEGVPILGYNVTITNTTSGENETMLVVDTTLLYSIDSDNEFTITVVPINAVGPGQPAAIYFPLSPSKSNLIIIVTQCAICPAGLYIYHDDVTYQRVLPWYKSHISHWVHIYPFDLSYMHWACTTIIFA